MTEKSMLEFLVKVHARAKRAQAFERIKWQVVAVHVGVTCGWLPFAYLYPNGLLGAPRGFVVELLLAMALGGAIGYLLSRNSPERFDEDFATTRAEVQANLLDHGLLPLVMEDTAQGRLPSLFRLDPLVALFNPALKHSPAQLSSLSARLQALVNNYADCCRDAGLDLRPGWQAPWYAMFQNHNEDPVLRAAVALEIVDALAGPGADDGSAGQHLI